MSPESSTIPYSNTEILVTGRGNGARRAWLRTCIRCNQGLMKKYGTDITAKAGKGAG